MKIQTAYILSAIILAGCTSGLDPAAPSRKENDPTLISVSCNVGRTVLHEDEKAATKALTGQASNKGEMSCNFIKVDETRIEGQSPQDYTYDPSYIDLSGAVIANATVGPASNTTVESGAGYDYFFREIRFKPTLSYQFNVPEMEVPTQENVTAYTSALVGWFPATEDVSSNASAGSNVLFKDTQSYTLKDGKVCVTFKNKLDGQTDLMVSDLREGRFNKKAVGFRNNDSDRDIQPFGVVWNDFMDYSQGMEYCNYISFKHYLSAVRLFLSVPESNLSLLSWGKITDVIIIDQPGTAVVELPVSQNRGTGQNSDGTTKTLPSEGVDPIYGKVVEWSDPHNIPIIRTAIFEEDADYPEMNTTVPEYPIIPGDNTSLESTYLGYCLVQPGKDVNVELITDAGIINFTVPRIASYTDSDGNSQTAEILKEGYVYDIDVQINTTGNIEIVVGNRDNKHFRNLAPFNSAANSFEDSNCYVITRDMMVKDADTGTKYQGFYFHAYTPGRGEKGTIAEAPYPYEMIFTPAYIDILWQDKNRPITGIQLLNGYCRFTLNEKCYDETDPLEGNAVIAAYNADGDIIWSWHIWVTSQIQDITYSNIPYRNYENCAPGTTLEGTNISDRFFGKTYSGYQNATLSFTMMNMNLGATASSWSETDNVVNTYGCYYQWGRKDPSIGPETYNYGLKTLNTAEYITSGGWMDTIYERLENYPEVQSGINYPLALVDPMMLNGDYHNDWLYASIDKLWGYDPTAKKVVKKTIYDPCPYGYRVADEELNALFYAAKNKAINFEETKSGYIIGGNNWFPYTGWKGHAKGRTDRTHAWFHVGDMADYQDARVSKFTSTTDGGYANHRGASILSRDKVEVIGVGNYDAGISPSYANRTTAAPVRCVRYNGPDEEPAAPTP